MSGAHHQADLARRWIGVQSDVHEFGQASCREIRQQRHSGAAGDEGGLRQLAVGAQDDAVLPQMARRPGGFWQGGAVFIETGEHDRAHRLGE